MQLKGLCVKFATEVCVGMGWGAVRCKMCCIDGGYIGQYRQQGHQGIRWMPLLSVHLIRGPVSLATAAVMTTQPSYTDCACCQLGVLQPPLLTLPQSRAHQDTTGSVPLLMLLLLPCLAVLLLPCSAASTCLVCCVCVLPVLQCACEACQSPSYCCVGYYRSLSEPPGVVGACVDHLCGLDAIWWSQLQ